MRHSEKDDDNEKNNIKERIERIIETIKTKIFAMISKMWEWLTERWQPFSTVLTALLLICNLYFVFYNLKANNRFEKLYISQIRPLIAVAPVGVTQDTKIEQVTTIFSILNYSGFEAYKIGVDIKYEDKSWILEWRKAHLERESKGDGKGVIDGKLYNTTPETIVQFLEAEEGVQRKIKGACNLETVCSKGADGIKVLIRVKWENKSGYVFDEVHQYKLICTRDNDGQDSGAGRAFNFIPEGIISQKNKI